MIFVELGMTDNPYLANTVLLGVGPGKKSHDEFFDMLVDEKQNKWEDTNELLIPFSFYSRHHGRVVNVFITLALALQDNPERRGCAYLLGGNSNNHGVYGISCDFDLLSVPFPACVACQDTMNTYVREGNFTQTSIRTDCKHCLGWSLDKLCELGVYKTDKPRADGLSLTEDEFGYELLLKPCRIDFKDCIAAWKYATEQFLNGTRKRQGYIYIYFAATKIYKNDSLLMHCFT
jgi:hypothetical protein